MPGPNSEFSPDQYQYYSTPEHYQALTYVVGLLTSDSGEKKTALKSKDNLKAYVYSLLPYKADSMEKLNEFIKLLPELKAPAKDQVSRRNLSEQARQAIVNTTANKWFAADNPKIDRTFRVLLGYDDSAEGRKHNKDIEDIVLNGTPEARGKLVEEKVTKTMEMFDKILEGKLSDQYIVENFDKLFAFCDMMCNACNFIKRIESGTISVSDDVSEKLKLMELYSTKADIIMQRAKLIANPNYEYLNLDPLLTIDNQTYESLGVYINPLFSDRESLGTRTLKDIGATAEIARPDLCTARKVGLMDRIRNDFDVSNDKPTVQFVNNSNELMESGYTLSANEREVDENLHHSYVLVTNKNDARCYHVDAAGNVEQVEAKDMLNDLADDMGKALDGVEQANKGFFIGSSEYRSALKAMNQVSKAIKGRGLPITMDENLKNQLESALKACKNYLDTKDPENFKNEREARRYAAMKKAADSCQLKLATSALQDKALSAVALAASKPAMSESKKAPAQNTIEQSLENFKTNVPPMSNAGKGAQDLHKQVVGELAQLLASDRPFNREQARDVMAKMVVLKMMDMGRKFDNGKAIAGDIEQAVNGKQQNAVIKAIRNDKRFAAMTENVTKEALEDFVMKGGAKKCADTISKFAQQKTEPSNVKSVSKEKTNNMVNQI